MKMSLSAGEQRMPVSRSRPARRGEGGAWLGFAIALWATKVGAAPQGSFCCCVSLNHVKVFRMSTCSLRISIECT